MMVQEERKENVEEQKGEKMKKRTGRQRKGDEENITKKKKGEGKKDKRYI